MRAWGKLPSRLAARWRILSSAIPPDPSRLCTPPHTSTSPSGICRPHSDSSLCPPAHSFSLPRTPPPSSLSSPLLQAPPQFSRLLRTFPHSSLLHGIPPHSSTLHCTPPFLPTPPPLRSPPLTTPWHPASLYYSLFSDLPSPHLLSVFGPSRETHSHVWERQSGAHHT